MSLRHNKYGEVNPIESKNEWRSQSIPLRVLVTALDFFVARDSATVVESHCNPMAPRTWDDEFSVAIKCDDGARISLGTFCIISASLADHFINLKPESAKSSTLSRYNIFASSIVSRLLSRLSTYMFFLIALVVRAEAWVRFSAPTCRI